MYYRIYQFLGWPFFILCSLPYYLYSAFTGRNRDGFGQRLGFISNSADNEDRSLRIWLHASSVGEVQVARALVAELKKVLPAAAFIVSTMTEQGRKVATRQLGNEARVVYAPLDLAGVVGRTLRVLRPAVYICLETELWPNILIAARRRGVKLVLLNGRLSERSFSRYCLIRGLVKKLLSCFSMISVIQAVDAERYLALGAEPAKVVVSGNAKYDLAVNADSASAGLKYRSLLNLERGQPLLVTGSTHTGEEQMLIRVFGELRAGTAPLADLVWAVAPRHLERLEEIERLFAENRIDFDRFSALESRGRRAPVVLVDRMGVLTGLYAAADYVFCGGSLVKRGGHNIMEAAVWGKPVFYGPSMKDFADAADLLESAGAGFPVASAQELAGRIQYFALHGEEYAAAGAQAREAALAQQGAAAKQVQLVLRVLGQNRS